MFKLKAARRPGFDWSAALQAAGIDPVLHDGCLVTAAALARGFDLVIYPRQVVTSPAPGPGDGASDQGQGDRMSFYHGLPQGSMLSSVTFTQDRRLRRALLERKGLRITEGASFSYKSEAAAARFSRKIGYPQSLKEVNGENLTDQINDIADTKALHAAIARMRRRHAERVNSASSLERSAYATTSLPESQEDEDGNKIAFHGVRFVIEAQPKGQYLRLYVLEDKVVAAVHFPKGKPPMYTPAEGLGATVVPAALMRTETAAQGAGMQVHPKVQRLAVRAMRAVPGLKLAAVDLVIGDPARAPQGQDWWVAELSERPRLDILYKADPQVAVDLARRIVMTEAARAGRSVAKVTAQIGAALSFEAVPSAPEFIAGLEESAARMGVQLQTGTGARIRGIVTAHARGRPQAIAILAEQAMTGAFRRQYPRLTEIALAEDAGPARPVLARASGWLRRLAGRLLQRPRRLIARLLRGR